MFISAKEEEHSFQILYFVVGLDARVSEFLTFVKVFLFSQSDRPTTCHLVGPVTASRGRPKRRPRWVTCLLRWIRCSAIAWVRSTLALPGQNGPTHYTTGTSLLVCFCRPCPKRTFFTVPKRVIGCRTGSSIRLLPYASTIPPVPGSAREETNVFGERRTAPKDEWTRTLNLLHV